MVALFFIYIVLGTVMDGLALLLLTLPIVFPVVIELGYDPVWFGVVIVLLIEMALITPPVGLTSYTVSGVTKVPLEGVFEGILPFFIAMVICLMILCLFPSIVLVLPQLAK
jgi:TRAP-type C4-dicarboxylate transport system permease large subunit